MMIIDCTDYGPVAPWIGNAEEMAGFMDYADHMILTHTPEFLNTWNDRWEMALAWESVMEDDVTEAWYARCLLLQAVAGLRGLRVPRVQVISN
jgi:hypothetical protein